MKRIISLILSLVMLLTIQIPISAERSDIKYYNIYKSIRIKGETEPVFANKFVTVILKNETGLLNMAETEIDSAGRYDLIFKTPAITDTAELIVKCADENITNTVYETLLTVSTIAEVSYNLMEYGSGYRINADLSELTLMTDKFLVVAAQYDESGKFVGVNTFKSEDFEDIQTFDEVIEKKGTIKLFVWESMAEILPVAKTSQGDGGLILRFGTLADKQQFEGYSAVTGDNNYQRYINAKSELPEEMDVISSIKPNVKREFYVSKNGDDSNSGSINSPFETIDRAIQEYNNLSDKDKQKWTAIYIMGGEYELSQGISITNEDAGLYGGARLLISAYDNEDVVLQNTMTVSGDKLKQVTNENTSEDVIARINEGVEKLYYIDYADLGIEKMHGYSYGVSGKKPVLTYNGSQGTLARYPNGGDTYIKQVHDGGYDDNNNYTENVEFTPQDKRPFTWQPTGEIGISGQLCVTWYYNHMQATFDHENGTVKTPSNQTVAQGWKCAANLLNHPETRAHFYYYNVFEEIDMKGEWCSSDAEKRIYIYPNDDVVTAEDTIRILGKTSGYAIKAENISDFVIDGITFDTLANGVRFENCERALIQNCEFNNIRTMGLHLENCKSSGVINTDFRNGYSGINIDGSDDNIINLEPQRNFIQNCYFNTLNETCINIGQANGNIISHNLAENYKGSFVGVFGGSENVIEYNETYAGGFNGNEANIIYIDGNFISRNNHIRYNYLHDASPDPNEILLGHGIVFDDLGENNYAYGNVFKNMNAGVSANGGDNNIIDSNVMIDCLSSAYVSDANYGSEYTYEKYLMSDLATSKLVNNYYNYGLASNSSWIRRYPYAADRIAYLEQTSETWNSGDHSSEEMRFAMGATGNYIINNTIVDSSDPYVGPNVTEFNVEIDPTSSEVTQLNGNDYNVLYNNTSSGSGTEVVQHAGMTREHSYIDGNSISVIYPQSSSTYQGGNTMEVVWNPKDNANFYKIIIAEDENFTEKLTEKWLIDNRHKQTIQTYPRKDSTYYYKIEAYNFGQSEEAFAVSETRSMTFKPYEQTEDITVISKNKANLASSWSSAAGTQYVRNILENSAPAQMTENDSKYVRFTAPAKMSNFRAIYGIAAYQTVEDFNAAHDPNTVLSMEMQVRFPDESKFGKYADVPAPQISPSGTAADQELGTHGRMLYFRVKKSDDKYVLYRGLTGIYGELLKVGEYTAEELFGRWITVKIDIDMASGEAEASFDGNVVIVDMNETTWGKEYNWNSENYLRFFDFVLNNGSDTEFVFDIKDVSVIRKVK